MPQLDPTHFPSQLFWLLLTFGMLVLFMHFWIVPRIQDTLHERHKQVEGKLVQIQALQSKIEALEHQQEALSLRSKEKIALSFQKAAEVRKKLMQANEEDMKKLLDEEVTKIKESLGQKENDILQDLRKNKGDFVEAVVTHITKSDPEKEI